ncbi:MAG: DUF3090 domain-containing protein [Anaerolineales bacterium]|nr:DUF3090 domain-containing protein [Anaerolineales bacterium]
MPGAITELNPVTIIRAAAIGQPGRRVFYLQARAGRELVTLIVEKAQLQSLAVAIEQLLAELRDRFPELPEASAAFTEGEVRLEQPIDPLFRVGEIGLGYDRDLDLLVLETRELITEATDPAEASVARFWCTRSQLRALARWGLELAGRGRPICGNCGEPIDPEGHFCPKRNGHKH